MNLNMGKTTGFIIWVMGIAQIALGGWTVLPEGIRELKETAANNHKPVLLTISRGKDCSHCVAAWKNAVCDGVHQHEEADCVPHDDVYGDYPINGWAGKYGVQLAYAHYAAGDNSQAGNKLFNRYRRAVSMPAQFPIFVLLHVKDGADLTMEGAEALYEDQVDVIGAFSFVAG